MEKNFPEIVQPNSVCMLHLQTKNTLLYSAGTFSSQALL